MCEYFQLDLKCVPDDKTRAEFRHVLSESGNNGAILFSELTYIKADQQKVEKNSRKRPFVTGERHFCATPLFDREVKREKNEELSENLETNGLKTDFAATLRDKNFEPCSYFKTSVTENEKGKSPDISEIDYNISNLINNLLCDDDRKLIDNNNLQITKNVSKEIEKNKQKKQSNWEQWYRECKIRITASNFGIIINRRKDLYQLSI